MDGYPAVPNRSATWDAAYEAFQRGEQLAMPHFESRPTDPKKQAALTEAYTRYRAGELEADALPDLADIFPDDPELRAEIGLQTKPGSTPAQVLIQACGSCHNDVLDQTISRARFSIDLARMSRAELDFAIARIELGAGTEGVMPPKEARQIAPEAVRPLVAYLRANVRTEEEDALLKRAAELGMAGGAGR
jgi:cytochrome c553